EVDRRDLQLGPLRHRHGQPAAVGIQAPLGHPLRLVLLGRQGAHHVLVQARREGVGFDVGDEAGVVAAAQALEDLGVLRRGFGDGGLGLGGHVAAWWSDPRGTCTAISRRRVAVGRGSAAGGGCSICARVTPRSASATTSLISRQLARTPHWWAIPHWLTGWLHSVIASGPSMASTISIRVMRL